MVSRDTKGTQHRLPMAHSTDYLPTSLVVASSTANWRLYSLLPAKNIRYIATKMHFINLQQII